MLDMKVLKSALDQLEEERRIPKEKIIEAIEQALAAAYKKDFGKRWQIIRANFDLETGEISFSQVKIVVDDSLVWMPKDEEAETPEGEERERFNSEKHILLTDARMIKGNAEVNDEIVFPLETKEDFGRIAAQTAKQVIMQRIREAERSSLVDEYGDKEGEIISGIIQKIESGTVIVDFNRAIGILPPQEQISGENFRRGERIRAYLYAVEEGARGVSLKLSRTHPMFLKKLFELEVPEIANNVVEVKSIAREPGSRSKMAVFSTDDHVDPVGSCVGGRGVRVTTVTNELGGEKVDIIEWSEDPSTYVSNSLSPAKVINIEVNEAEHKAFVEVADDQLSLAIGKGGQNVRLAAKLTGWRIDIKGITAESVTSSDGETVDEDAGFTSLKDLKNTYNEGVDMGGEEVEEDGIVDDGTDAAATEVAEVSDDAEPMEKDA
jgi:N utilization substance protein A